MSTSLVRALGAAATAALLLAGCSSVSAPASSSGATGSGASGSGSASAAADPQAAAAKQKIDAATSAVQSFTAPGPAITGVAGLKGKTVHFVPANYQIPLFQGIKASLESAFGPAGIKLQVCDGKANPSNMASCITQAVDAKADAVVTGSIPEDLVPVAFETVRKAGIPLVNMMTAPAGKGDPKQIAYLTPDFIGLQSLAADWVIADSGAAANVLVVQITDTPATNIWMEQGALAEYQKNCSKCKVTVVKANTGQLDKLPGLVTSELTKNSAIRYVQTEFDFAVQPTVQALQSAADGGSVKVVSQDGTLAVLQMLGSGRFVNGAVGFNADALSWYAADDALRMMSGRPGNVNVTFPYQRMFTKDNVGSLKLTPEAEKSGEWYGATDYRQAFTKLWGLG